MQSATVGSRPDRLAALALVLAATGLALVAVGGAVLTRGLIDLLDGDARWGSLIVGSTATASGAIVFFRNSRAWASGGTPARTTASRAGRVLAAIAAVAIGVVAFAVIGGAVARSLAGQPLFESSCSEMDSIICGMQGAFGAGLAGPPDRDPCRR